MYRKRTSGLRRQAGFFIVWGKKQVTTSLGYVADFCPLCREVREFGLERIGMAGHVYYITLSEGDLVGFLRRCGTCRSEFDAAPKTYREPSRRQVPLAELVAATYPDLKEAWAGRLQLEADIRQPFTKLAAADRLVLVAEPFRLLAYRVEKRLSGLRFDWIVVATIAAAIAGFPLIASPLGGAFPAAADEILIGWTLTGLAAVVAQFILARTRFVRNEILPLLAISLRPLKPTAAEIDAALKELKGKKLKIGSAIKAQAVLGALQQDSAPQAVGVPAA